MKQIASIRAIAILTALVVFLGSCEQEYFEPNLSTAPGGGTVSTYKAYTLSSEDPGGDNIYGRIVFYKYSSTVTLVQIGLYNTNPDQSYSADIYGGAVETGGTLSKSLDAVSGESGAFSSSKYFTISDASFFEGLADYDASVKVMLGSTTVAAGDIGMNADPVAEQD